MKLLGLWSEPDPFLEDLVAEEMEETDLIAEVNELWELDVVCVESVAEEWFVVLWDEVEDFAADDITEETADDPAEEVSSSSSEHICWVSALKPVFLPWGPNLISFDKPLGWGGIAVLKFKLVGHSECS